MTKEEFCEDALKELSKIESGEVSIELSAGDILLGKVHYRTSTGWEIVIFSDGDVWDYIRSMIPPSKEDIEIWPEREEEDCEGFKRLRCYHPPKDQLKKIWGFIS